MEYDDDINYNCMDLDMYVHVPFEPSMWKGDEADGMGEIKSETFLSSLLH